MKGDHSRTLEETSRLLDAARASGIDVGMVRTTATRASFVDKVAKPRAPALWIVADIGNRDQSYGLDGFHGTSLLALRDRIDAVVINEADGDASNYAAALARASMHREIVAVVETTPRHWADWMAFFEAKPAGPPVMLAVIVPPEGYS